MHYESAVRGELGDRSAPEFAGLALKARDGRTALVGKVLDPLHGLSLVLRGHVATFVLVPLAICLAVDCACPDLSESGDGCRESW